MTATSAHPLSTSPVDNAYESSESTATIETAPKKVAASLQGLATSALTPAMTREVSMATPQDKPTLLPDDARHGTNAGHVAGCRLRCCGEAKLRYDKIRKRERDVLGHGRQVSALGYRRRIQALNALGWPIRLLADELGVSLGTLSARIYRAEKVYVRNHEQLAELYERLCMTTFTGPLSDRTRRQAAAAGYAPPLAWDDIDNDPEPINPRKVESKTDIDEMRVQRVLDGVPAKCTLAERFEVIERWEGSRRELQLLTGWNVNRDLTRKAA